MSNVYIIGAQASGKTTLVNALEAQLEAERNVRDGTCPSTPTTIIREVARTVLKEREYSREDIITSPSRALNLQKDILEAQYRAESVASATDTTSWYMCDRSGLDPIVYAACFVGPEAAAEMLASGEWLELEARMKSSIVFLCEAGSRWLIDDGVRLMLNDMAELRRIDTTFRNFLEMRSIEYAIIPHDMESLSERVDHVRSVMEAARAKRREESTGPSGKHERVTNRLQ